MFEEGTLHRERFLVSRARIVVVGHIFHVFQLYVYQSRETYDQRHVRFTIAILNGRHFCRGRSAR